MGDLKPQTFSLVKLIAINTFQLISILIHQVLPFFFLHHLVPELGQGEEGRLLIIRVSPDMCSVEAKIINRMPSDLS